MIFNLSGFTIFIYGRNEDNINEMNSNFSSYQTIKIIIDGDEEERIAINNIFDDYYFQHAVFVNADTMKRVPIVGTESIGSVVDKVNDEVLLNKPFLITFNRYYDGGNQVQYVKEITNGVSLFRSFNPGNSDCFYVSKGVVEHVRKNYQGGDYIKKVFSLARAGEFSCFSFNPDLYVFKFKDSPESYTVQQSKTSTYRPQSSFDIDESVAKFFSSHLILFWIFFVFFVCTVFIILVKVFKIGYLLV